MSAVLKALSTPRRREILRVVWDGERSAGEIHEAIGEVTFGAISQHLKVLEEAGLVKKRIDGRRHLYVAEPDALGPLRAWLESMWDEKLADLKALAERDGRPKTKKKKRKRS